VILNTERSQGPKWYGPYLSAAANVEWGAFNFDLDETVRYGEMSPDERAKYRFQASEELVPYKHNSVGYVYFVAAATSLLPWLPDLAAIEGLQIALHVFFCIWIIYLLRSPTAKLLFLLLYALNPLVIYYVTIPFYYFVQAIPSFLIVLLLLAITDNRWPDRPAAFVLGIAGGAVLGLALLTRPTTIGAVLGVFALAITTHRMRWPALAGAAVLALVVLTGRLADDQHGPWHTAYIGLGAYPNEFVTDDFRPAFNDDVGYAFYLSQRGVQLDTELGGNYYEDEVIEDYMSLLRQEYLSVVRKDWPNVLRNATLNTLQGFSVGHVRQKGYSFQLPVAASGLVVLAAMAWTGQYVLILLIGATVGTFTVFAPPIPGYMYGAYALLVFGAVEFLRRKGILARCDAFLHRRVSSPGKWR
jgi:hypothetical protein